MFTTAYAATPNGTTRIGSARFMELLIAGRAGSTKRNGGRFM